MNKGFDALVDGFIEDRVGVDTTFLSQELVNGLSANIFQLQEQNLMKSAGIGNDEIRDPNQKMRGDKIFWLDKNHTNLFEKEFLSIIDNFIAHLNKTCYTGINSYEFHYAVYGEESFYKKHIDSFRNDSNRKFSFINYLNKDWQEADGGQLWLHDNGNIKKILPHAGTAVFFQSDQTEHEVTVTHRLRMSISGWLKRV